MNQIASARLVTKENPDVTKTPKISKDINMLTRFIDIFCRRQHSNKTISPVRAQGEIGDYLKDTPVQLCPECKKLLLYAVSKRMLCPYDPKPRCKKCPTQCYRDSYREQIREVMRSSGAYLLKHGRIDLMIKYFF